MDLFLARHGETVSNAVGRALGGGGDSPLTANGVRQAEEMGKLLAGITFDAVYSSPLGRAVDTVRIAFQGKAQPSLDGPCGLWLAAQRRAIKGNELGLMTSCVT